MAAVENVSLDSETVVTVVRDQFPVVKPETAELLGEGTASYAYLVDGKWVFRFPKSKESELALEVELKVLEEIAGNSPLPLPTYRFSGEPTAHFGYHFAGYPLVPGTQLMHIDLPKTSFRRLAEQLGSFLDYVHSFDLTSLPKNLLRRGDAMPEVRETALHMLQAVRSTIPRTVFDRCRSFLADSNRLPSSYTGDLRLVHDDLGDEHILVDPRHHTVTGVIDWGGVALGDPAKDFAGLWTYGGDEFVQQALEMYQMGTDIGFWDRVRYRGVWHAVAYLDHGFETKFPEYSRRGLEVLERTFK